LRLFSFGGYGLALVALVLEVFGAYDSYPTGQQNCFFTEKSGLIFFFEGERESEAKDDYKR